MTHQAVCLLITNFIHCHIFMPGFGVFNLTKRKTKQLLVDKHSLIFNVLSWEVWSNITLFISCHLLIIFLNIAGLIPLFKKVIFVSFERSFEISEILKLLSTHWSNSVNEVIKKFLNIFNLFGHLVL